MLKKILFIEDERALQKTFHAILKEKGYELISAYDGESGLRLAKEEKPDLILLDLILPKIHGLDVLEALKKDPATKEIPVIVLTNVEQIDAVQRALELGATTYLVKAQYTIEEVLEKIEKILK
jgi:DNA-binding response OmpR family regulator